MNNKINEVTGLGDIINLELDKVSDWMKLSRIEKDKYNMIETRARVSNIELSSIDELIYDRLLNEASISIVTTVLKQMKYHSGRPLNITLTEQGPTKYMPLIKYFEGNSEYLSDYDYIILNDSHYLTLLDENFVYVRDNTTSYTNQYLSWPRDIDTDYNKVIKKVGKYNNLDLYITNMFTPDEGTLFDAIIGKREWAEGSLIHFSDDVKSDDDPDSVTYSIKTLFRLLFPIKRGFMRLQAKY